MNRRSFLTALGLAPFASPLLASEKSAQPKGQSEHCIFIWLGGGMSQIDTFDPKALGDNKATKKKAGSLYPSIATSVAGVRLSEHLPRTAQLMEHVTAVRSVNHKVIDEHAFATNLVHTGRMISGNATYPSIGSIVANRRGAADASVPAYMLIGYPNVSRGPGFLGIKDGYIYLVDTQTGPNGFTRPEGVTNERDERRRALLGAVAESIPADSNLAEYAEAQREAFRLAGPSFMRHFDLSKEPAAVRESFGGEFGQRCLTARRLIQGGVRFVEVSHNLNFINGTGWDVHNHGIDNQHILIRELDNALAGLITDLKIHGLLEKTLVVVGTEFGRPPEFDANGGRGHQGTAFSMILAGGGLKHCGAYGTTDEIAKKVVENPVSLPDFHATILAAMQVDLTHDLMAGARPVPITDGGTPIAKLF
jgi:uncharacterized protein (DUF1501 family)